MVKGVISLMKHFVATLLFLLPCLTWASQNDSFHLRDYILTAQQIEKLPPKDQATYLTFLYHFVSVIESAQAKDSLKPKSRSADKNALLDIFRGLRFDWKFLSEVNATENSSFGIFGRWAESRQPNAAYMKALDSTATNYFSTVSAAYNTNLFVTGFDLAYLMTKDSGRVPASGGEPPAGRVRTAEESAAPPPPADPAVAPAAAPPPPPPPGPLADTATPPPVVAGQFRVEGASCLFGGWISKYRKKGDGRLVCPSPRGKINQGTCLGDQRNPKFKCNSFGMESGPAQEALQTATCIEMRPLADLTVRCTAAITTWIQSSPPTSMDATAYTAWRAEMIKHLDQFETGFSSTLKFSEYCADSNKKNEGRQANECNAVTTLFAKLREMSPTATAVVASAAGAPPAAVVATDGETTGGTPDRSATPRVRTSRDRAAGADRGTAAVAPKPAARVRVVEAAGGAVMTRGAQ